MEVVLTHKSTLYHSINSILVQNLLNYAKRWGQDMFVSIKTGDNLQLRAKIIYTFL